MWLVFEKETFRRTDDVKALVPEEAVCFTLVGGGQPIHLYAWHEQIGPDPKNITLRWRIWTPSGSILLGPEELVMDDDGTVEFPTFGRVLTWVNMRLTMLEEES